MPVQKNKNWNRAIVPFDMGFNKIEKVFQKF